MMKTREFANEYCFNVLSPPIGKCAVAVVLNCIRKKDKNPVAIKMIMLTWLSPEEVNHVIQEAEMLNTKISHPYIMKVLDYAIAPKAYPDRIFIVMEKMKENLGQYLQRNPNPRKEFFEKVFF